MSLGAPTQVGDTHSVVYEAVASADTGDLEVQLNVSDHYFWSPSDCSRTTQCLHECGQPREPGMVDPATQ